MGEKESRGGRCSEISLFKELVHLSPLFFSLLGFEKADLIVRDFQLFIGRENKVERIDLPPEQSGRQSVQNPISGFLDLLTGAGENISPFECAIPVFDMTSAILDSAESARS